MGVAALDRCARELNVRDELKVMLEHMILSHHDLPEYGSPRRPMFPEAEVLHTLDVLDARMFEMRRELAMVKPGGFTERIWSLERRLYPPQGNFRARRSPRRERRGLICPPGQKRALRTLFASAVAAKTASHARYAKNERRTKKPSSRPAFFAFASPSVLAKARFSPQRPAASIPAAALVRLETVSGAAARSIADTAWTFPSQMSFSTASECAPIRACSSGRPDCASPVCARGFHSAKGTSRRSFPPLSPVPGGAVAQKTRERRWGVRASRRAAINTERPISGSTAVRASHREPAAQIPPRGRSYHRPRIAQGDPSHFASW